MTANPLVFKHSSMNCEVVNSVEDGPSEEDDRLEEGGPSEDVYRIEIESSLYNFYSRNVHTVWGILDAEENCQILWDWCSSYLTCPCWSHPMITVVHGQLALAAHYKGEEIWRQYYSRLCRKEIAPGYITFETFIAFSLLVENPDIDLQVLILRFRRLFAAIKTPKVPSFLCVVQSL